jgi:hypothetical protein
LAANERSADQPATLKAALGTPLHHEELASLDPDLQFVGGPSFQ